VNRFGRALGILLFLRGGRTVSASELARRFEVSPRTIYRDIGALSAVGTPIYAEVGRAGGFRLLDGYFLPPVMFTLGEATSLLIGLALLDRLRAKPFAGELETAAAKLVAALPSHLQTTLAQARRLIGFEAVPSDLLHPEPAAPGEGDEKAEAGAITTFLQALFAGRAVALTYHSPYRGREEAQAVAPYGVFGDRDRWYLVGRRLDQDATTIADEKPRLWRADRVLAITQQTRLAAIPPTFDIAQALGRVWLGEAMATWRANAPVAIRMTSAQAERLRQDWYYGRARFEPCGEPGAGDNVMMTIGESDRDAVFALLRWLGPGAELVSPMEWRAAFAAEVRGMLASYEDASSSRLT
jgi:predicted DNA-binding transcriptional regulator YafY